MWETWVRSQNQENPLEKEMATHSNILSEEFHVQRILVGYSPWGCKESYKTDRLMFYDAITIFLIILALFL